MKTKDFSTLIQLTANRKEDYLTQVVLREASLFFQNAFYQFSLTHSSKDTAIREALKRFESSLRWGILNRMNPNKIESFIKKIISTVLSESSDFRSYSLRDCQELTDSLIP